jgi:lysophospholipase L1-like esterase
MKISLYLILTFILFLSGLFVFFSQETMKDDETTNLPQKKLVKIDNSAANPNIRYLGRFDLSNPKKASFAWSGSSIRARFEGKKCFLKFKNHSESNYFAVFIDNVEKPIVLELNEEQEVYEVASNLSEGEHDILIFKQTEARCGVVDFLGFELEKNKRLVPFEQKKQLKIEFIGNSITCGYGNEAQAANEKFKTETENHYLSFASITARKLNAEHFTIAYSGKGLVRNYGLTTDQIIPKIYTKIYPQSSKDWGFKQWIPDAVVICLGTNDLANSKIDSTLFVNKYVDFVSQIRSNYADATIFLLNSPMLVNFKKGKEAKDDFSPRQTLENYIQSTLAILEDQDLKKLHYFAPSQQGKYGYGAMWHPSLKQHEVTAEELSEFMKKKF